MGSLFHEEVLGLLCRLLVMVSYASAPLVCSLSVGNTKCLLDTYLFSGRYLAVPFCSKFGGCEFEISSASIHPPPPTLVAAFGPTSGIRAWLDFSIP